MGSYFHYSIFKNLLVYQLLSLVITGDWLAYSRKDLELDPIKLKLYLAYKKLKSNHIDVIYYT